MTISIKGKKVVTKLQCKVCTKHKLRKHFSTKWIEEVDSIRTIEIRDHISADQHIHVIEIEKTEPMANHIVLTLSIYHEELLMYISDRPGRLCEFYYHD